MHAFDVLGDPVRRRILELLAGGEASAGDVAATVREEFGISQPAVSQHLKVLRDNGFAHVRAEGTRRLYSVDPTGMRDLLAALPDPGPMPDDLVARITAALAQESRAASLSPSTDAGNVVPLHPRRGGLRHLGVAAAVVAAIDAQQQFWLADAALQASLIGKPTAASISGAAQAQAGGGEQGH